MHPHHPYHHERYYVYPPDYYPPPPGYYPYKRCFSWGRFCVGFFVVVLACSFLLPRFWPLLCGWFSEFFEVVDGPPARYIDPEHYEEQGE